MTKDSVEVMNRVVEKVLQFTLDNGTFGMEVVDQFHDRLPETTCEMCGKCCFSISYYSIEYHRIVRHLTQTCTPGELRIIFYKCLNTEDRLTFIENDKRIRCLFLENDTNKCSIHTVRPFPCRIFGQDRDGVRECENVNSPRPVPEGYYETLLITLANNSEQLHIPVEGKDHVIDFFPFEFWVRRAVLGKEKAIEWFVMSHYYEKYVAEFKRQKGRKPLLFSV